MKDNKSFHVKFRKYLTVSSCQDFVQCGKVKVNGKEVVVVFFYCTKKGKLNFHLQEKSRKSSCRSESELIQEQSQPQMLNCVH